MKMKSCFLSLAALLLCVETTVTHSHATLVRFSTTLGEFDVELFDDEAPITVENFLGYVQRGAYDDTFVHRNVLDFVIQGGGFYSNLIPVPTDPPILNESGISNLRGTIAMARLPDPDSATSQWFINVVDNTFLDTASGGYAVFGEVLGDGMLIVDNINQLQTVDANSPVSLPIVVEQITIVPEPTALVSAFLGLLGIGLFCWRKRSACVRSETAWSAGLET